MALASRAVQSLERSLSRHSVCSSAPVPEPRAPSPAVYIELHTSSAFSFLRAASLPEPLIERAAMLGYPAVALLDRDGVYGAPRFHKAAHAAGLRADHRRRADDRAARPGARDWASREPRSTTARTAGRPAPSPQSLVPVRSSSSSQEGWRNLCRLLTR